MLGDHCNLGIYPGSSRRDEATHNSKFWPALRIDLSPSGQRQFRSVSFSILLAVVEKVLLTVYKGQSIRKISFL
jgi:hypothetical protein